MLVVAACLLVAGRVLWSRVDTHHVRNITAASVCAEPPVDESASAPAIQSELLPAGQSSAQVLIAVGDCPDTFLYRSDSWNTPNHVAALVLFALGLVFGVIGVALARSHPAEPNEPASDGRA